MSATPVHGAQGVASTDAMAAVHILPGELTVRARRVDGPDLVAVRAWIPGGARVEAIPGEATIAGRSLAEGTRGRDYLRISDDAEDLGAELSGSASFEAHGVAIDARGAHWEAALGWAAELLAEPVFPEERCRWVARQGVGELASLGDQPGVRTAWRFLEQLYAPHPRARPLLGSLESLESLTGADCARFHRHAAAGGACVTVAGRIDEERVALRAEEIFAPVLALSRAAAAENLGKAPDRVPAPAGLPERRLEVALPEGDQAHLYAGCLTVARAHRDRHALEILGVVLGAGAGLTGRMPLRVREAEGLAYSVQVQTLAGAGLDPGRLVVYVGTSPATVAQAERAVREELDRLISEGVSAEEVEEARSYLLGRDPFRRETARQWADLLGEAALYGVPEDDLEWRRRELAALDAAAITRAAREHVDLERLRVTVGLPA